MSKNRHRPIFRRRPDTAALRSRRVAVRFVSGTGEESATGTAGNRRGSSRGGGNRGRRKAYQEGGSRAGAAEIGTAGAAHSARTKASDMARGVIAAIGKMEGSLCDVSKPKSGQYT
jgi:hypothetical protein